MRLRFFDRFRRLIRRRPATDTVPAAAEPHGRHRRARRQNSAPPAESRVMPAGSAGPPAAAGGLRRPGRSRRAAAPDAARRLAGRGIIAGAAYPGGTRRVGEGADPRGTPGRGRFRRDSPARAGCPSPRTRWHDEPRPAPAHAASTGLADGHAAELARVAAGVPRQPGAARPIVAPRGRSGAADQAAVHGSARQGAAADGGRPQELRLDRAHPVAAVGYDGAASARGDRGGRPAGRTS